LSSNRCYCVKLQGVCKHGSNQNISKVTRIIYAMFLARGRKMRAWDWNISVLKSLTGHLNESETTFRRTRTYISPTWLMLRRSWNHHSLTLVWKHFILLAAFCQELCTLYNSWLLLPQNGGTFHLFYNFLYRPMASGLVVSDTRNCKEIYWASFMSKRLMEGSLAVTTLARLLARLFNNYQLLLNY